MAWGTCRFNAAADRLLRTANTPVGAGPWTLLLDVSFLTSGAGLHQTILGLGPTASSYIFTSAGPTTMPLYCEGGNSEIVMSGAGFTFAPLQWYTVAFQRGVTANSLAIYVNDMTTPRLSGAGAQGTEYARFEFGGFGATNLHRLDGLVRRILWWEAIRSAAELEAQRTALAALVRTNLAGEYLFSDGNGQDTSGLTRHFTVVGAPTFTALSGGGGPAASRGLRGRRRRVRALR